MVDPLTLWLIAGASLAVGALLGVLFERTRGTAAQRAAKFEADLVQARSDLMHYQEQTKHHFGKSAELLGRMATDYREFLDHFVSGAETLCGPNLQELNASGLDRPLLDGVNGMAPAAPAPITTTAMPAPAATLGTAVSVAPVATARVPPRAPIGMTTNVPPIATIAAANVPPMPPIAANATVPPLAALDSDPLIEDVAK